MTKKSFSTNILHGKVRILSCSYTVRDHIYIYIHQQNFLSPRNNSFHTLFYSQWHTDYAQPDAEGSCSSGFVKQGAINGATPESICGEY